MAKRGVDLPSRGSLIVIAVLFLSFSSAALLQDVPSETSNEAFSSIANSSWCIFPGFESSENDSMIVLFHA